MIFSKIYKVKIENTDISVTIDDSFTANGATPQSNYKNIHYHAQYEFFFLSDNPLLILNEQEPLEYKNCIVCIPPFFNHTSIRNKCYRLLISYKTHKESEFSKFMDSFSSLEKPISVKISTICRQYMEELEALIYTEDKLSHEIATSLLKLIFYNIYKSNVNMKENMVRKTHDSYLVTIDKVLNDYQQKIDLKTLANELNLSTKQASRIIRKNYKTTFSDLLTKKRLSVACSLLANSNMPIIDIVEYINFPSESYFYSQFKKFYSCTPLQYRKTKQTNI